MAGPYRERIYGAAVKVETISGTDAVPTAALNAIQTVGAPELEWGYLESGERDDVQTGRLGRADRTTPAGRWAKITLTVEIKGGGSPGSLPEYDALMLISGHSKTVTPGVSVLYSTLDDAMPTGTIYAWSSGKLFKIVGCSATLELNADAAKRGFKKFSVQGVMRTDPVEASFPVFSYAAQLPALFHSGVANIGAWLSTDATDPLVLKSVSVNEQIQIVERPSAGALDGIIGYAIGDRSVRQTMVVEVPALATFDPWAVAKAAGDVAPLSAWQFGQVAGNRMIAQTGRWSLNLPKIAGQGGLQVMTLEGGLGIGSAPTSNREINYLYN